LILIFSIVFIFHYWFSLPSYFIHHFFIIFASFYHFFFTASFSPVAILIYVSRLFRCQLLLLLFASSLLLLLLFIVDIFISCFFQLLFSTLFNCLIVDYWLAILASSSFLHFRFISWLLFFFQLLRYSVFFLSFAGYCHFSGFIAIGQKSPLLSEGCFVFRFSFSLSVFISFALLFASFRFLTAFIFISFIRYFRLLHWLAPSPIIIVTRSLSYYCHSSQITDSLLIIILIRLAHQQSAIFNTTGCFLSLSFLSSLPS